MAAAQDEFGDQLTQVGSDVAKVRANIWAAPAALTAAATLSLSREWRPANVIRHWLMVLAVGLVVHCCCGFLSPGRCEMLPLSTERGVRKAKGTCDWLQDLHGCPADRLLCPVWRSRKACGCSMHAIWHGRPADKRWVCGVLRQHVFEWPSQALACVVDKLTACTNAACRCMTA